MKPENRTFIISGGCSGLGLATARDLHDAGGYISLLDLNADAGAELVKEFGSRARFFETDVSSTASVEQAVNGTAAWIKETGKELGGVVAAAGVGAAQKVWYHNPDQYLWLILLGSSTDELASQYPYRRSILSSTSTCAAPWTLFACPCLI
jgi:NAD(P)-dependent dehydrogenase (short-subunit alcohol dehydrogenase family)